MLLFGVLFLGQAAAAFLAPPSPALTVGLCLAGLAVVWFGVERIVVQRLTALARLAGSAGEVLHDRSEEPRAPIASLRENHADLIARADELGSIARALEALAVAIETRDTVIRDAEYLVRHNEARYRELFDANPHPMLVYDRETLEILAANDAAVAQYGFSRHQFLRMTVRHLLADAVTGTTGVLERMALNQMQPSEDVHRRRDGSLMAVQVTSHRIRFASRPAALAMLLDITLRKRIEADDRRHTTALEALYATAREHAESLSVREVARSVVASAIERFGALAVVLCRVRDEGDLETLAAGMRTQDGRAEMQSDSRWPEIESEESTASPTVRALHDRTPVPYAPTAEIVPACWQEMCMGRAGCWALALPLVSRDRVFGVLHILNEPVPTAETINGRAIGLPAIEKAHEEQVSVLTSLSLLAAAALMNASMHEELQRNADILEERVLARTEELEAANKELEAFAYSVSHDLRAPLRAVDGFSRLALMQYGREIPAECRTLLESVRCGVAEMSALITALLTFSRSARQPLNVQSVCTADLVRSVVEGLEHEMTGRQIEIMIGELPDCVADPILLKQVFANLLSNAIKFTAKRSTAHIEVGATMQDAETVYYVKDDGAGFDPNRAHRLFGVFQRLHRSEDFPGTGVGLATVQRVVVRHGGRIWYDAAPDQGATFFFTLRGRSHDEKS
jgi:PAS domain S-box-containing protein